MVPGVAVINDLIVGVENRDGNAKVRFHQRDLQFLQVPAISYSIVQFRAEEDKQNKNLRLQVRLRVCKMDYGGQTKCA